MTASDHNELSAMLSAARAANEVLYDWFTRASNALDRDQLLGSKVKSTDYAHYGYEDAFTQADIDSEAVILPLLTACRPDIALVSEESSPNCAEMPDGSERWLVDPLDGTSCFKKGLPNFSVTLAKQTKVNGEWKTDIGIVSEPMTGQIYVSGKTGNARLYNQDPLIAPRPLFNRTPEPAAFSGGVADQLAGNTIEVVVYSKANQAIINMRAPLVQRLKDSDAIPVSTFSSALVIARMAATGKPEGVILAGNALDYAWDTDAAIHIAKHAGMHCKRYMHEGEPVVLLAHSKTLLRALETTYAQEYQKSKAASTPSLPDR